MIRKILGTGSVGVLVDVGLNSADLLLTAADILFTPVMVYAFTIAPEVSFINQEATKTFAVIIAVLYVVHLLTEEFKARTNDD